MLKKKNKQQQNVAPPKVKDELQEIMNSLNSTNLETRRQAVRRIISGMTLGKDVSALFPLIVKNMETPNIELKKLIYLYIINYAKQHPDMTIMAVNSFQKDGLDPNNPFLRGLAVRTMGCLKIKGLVEYLQEPLSKSLSDQDAYVRKTGILCVAKIYDSNPIFIKEGGFIDQVKGALKDGNSMVVTNAIQALISIEEKGGPKFEVDYATINKFLLAFEESNEWSQTVLLDAMVRFLPQNSQQAETVIDRVTSGLYSKNSSVVMGVIKVIMSMLNNVDDSHLIRKYHQQIATKLTSFTSRQKEIQYIALKNVQLIAENQPSVFSNENLKFFFCKYSDPLFIKAEKLKILVILANEDNIDQILLQLKEYISEINVHFVRLCIRTIGKLAIKIENAADKCVHALFDSLDKHITHNGPNLILQETIIVMKDIFRKYKNQYVSLLGELFKDVTGIDQPEAKAAIIWIFGEYLDHFERPENFINAFLLDSFVDQTTQVQQQILTAAAKYFLFNPKLYRDVFTKILEILLDSDNVDLRRRANFYQILIQSNPKIAKKIINGEKPPVSEEGFSSSFAMNDQVMQYLSTLACIFQKLPASFTGIKTEFDMDFEDEDELNEDLDNNIEGELPEAENFVDDQDQMNYLEDAQKQEVFDDADFFDDQQNQQQQQENFDFQNMQIPLQEVYNENQAGHNGTTGVRLEAAMQLQNEQIIFECKISNFSQEQLSNFRIKFNVNSYCLAPDSDNLNGAEFLNPNESKIYNIGVNLNGNPSGQEPTSPMQIQIAVQAGNEIYPFVMPVYFHVLFRKPKEYQFQEFNELIKQKNFISKMSQLPFNEVNKAFQDNDFIVQKMVNNNFTFVGAQQQPTKVLLNFVVNIPEGDVPIRVLVQQNSNQIPIDFRVYHASQVDLFQNAVEMILNS